MRDEVLLDEIARQTAEQERPERISYQPDVYKRQVQARVLPAQEAEALGYEDGYTA